MQDGAGNENQERLQQQQQQPQQQQPRQNRQSNSVMALIAVFFVGFMIVAGFVIGTIFLLNYMKEKNIADKQQEIELKKLDIAEKQSVPLKLKETEKVYSPLTDKVHKDDIESKNIDAATTISLAGTELEKKKMELEALKYQKPQNQSSQSVHKTFWIQPIQTSPPVNNSGWESPFKNLNEKVDANQKANDQRFDKIEIEVKDLGGQVSDVKRGVDWLIKDAQRPDPKTTQQIQEQQQTTKRNGQFTE